MKNTIDYNEFKNKWKQFFLDKGFHVDYEDDSFLTFNGCKPLIRVEVYCGEYRTDTETGGCICADFAKCYNKVSQCPFYSDLTISEKELWECIELLMNAGEDWSNHFGRLVKQNGYYVCEPHINTDKKEKTYRNNR